MTVTSLTPEQLDGFLNILKQDIGDSVLHEIKIEKGYTTVYVDGWTSFESNGTKTITIKINGGVTYG